LKTEDPEDGRDVDSFGKASVAVVLRGRTAAVAARTWSEKRRRVEVCILKSYVFA